MEGLWGGLPSFPVPLPRLPPPSSPPPRPLPGMGALELDSPVTWGRFTLSSFSRTLPSNLKATTCGQGRVYTGAEKGLGAPGGAGRAGGRGTHVLLVVSQQHHRLQAGLLVGGAAGGQLAQDGVGVVGVLRGGQRALKPHSGWGRGPAPPTCPPGCQPPWSARSSSPRGTCILPLVEGGDMGTTLQGTCPGTLQVLAHPAAGVANTVRQQGQGQARPPPLPSGTLSPPGLPSHWTPAHGDASPPGPQPTWTPARRDPSPPGPQPVGTPAHLDTPPAGTPSPPGLSSRWTPALQDPSSGTHHCSQLLVICWPGAYRCPCSLQ